MTIATATKSDLARAEAEIVRVRSALPFPDDVLACLVHRTADAPALLAAARSARSADAASLAPLLEASQRCVQAVRAGPEFARALQALGGGELSEAQLACVSKRYADLDPGQAALAIGAASNPDGPTAKTDPVPAILAACGVELPKG